MIISRKWLQQYVDISDLTIEEVAEKLTNSGSEVEGIEVMSQGSNLVIGKVVSCVDHPDSDHLHVCQVDLGNEVTQIVCGAPNVAAGKNVIVACVGAILLGGEIKAGVIRGQESNGMICCLLELGVDPHYVSDESKEGIEVLDEDAPVGHLDPLAYLGLDDEIMDVGLTPNRNDCLAAWNMALEVGALLERDVTIPNCIGASKDGNISNLVVHSESEKCPLFIGKVIGEVSIKPSVKWMRELLHAAGMKSINNVVDISNIVMLETGQPVHFYDLDAISAREITVKDHIQAPYTALDGVTYDLQEEDIVITSQGKPIGIAGIMGGDDSKIEESTRGIIIEAAMFDHVSIRNTARRLNINSDASIRYQKGIEPLATYKAMDRCVQLLVEYADAKRLEETKQYGREHYESISFDVNLQRINTLLGTDFKEDEVMNVLYNLHLMPKKQGDNIHVSIPSYRKDLCIEADIAEEIIRILGYDRLTSTMPSTTSTLGALNKRQKLRRKIQYVLSDIGYNEAITYTLVSDQKIQDAVMGEKEVYELASPMSEDRRYIRNSILPSLLDSIAYNQARSLRDIALFEISNVYGIGKVEERLCVAASGCLHKNRWQNYQVNVDFFTMKGLVEALCSSIGFDEHRISFHTNTLDQKNFHPYRSAQVYLGKECLGIVGQIHPSLAKQYDIQDTYALELNIEILLKNKPSKVKFSEVSKFPSVTRDLAFVVKEDMNVVDIIRSIKKNGKLDKENVIQQVEVFDVYVGEHVAQGFKSIALSIIFQSYTRTLKDSEINGIHDNILETLKQELQAELRG